MQYINLSKALQNLDNVYLISGTDRYLCYDALKKITESANITMPQVNYISINNTSMQEIAETCQVFPFIDAHRMVVVNEFNGKIGQNNAKMLENYLSNPMKSTILVFFNLEGDAFFSKVKDKLTHIDCNKLDLSSVATYIKKQFESTKTPYEQSAVNLIATYCLQDMQRTSTETEKLICYSAGQKTITPGVVQNLVAEDKEYQIYNLADLIAKNNGDSALDLVKRLGGGMGLLGGLYNNYRRALYVAITPGTDAQLAKDLGIKEYAVKMMRNQIRFFTPKKLKMIVDKIAEADSKIKQGYLKEDLYVPVLVMEILKIRKI